MLLYFLILDVSDTEEETGTPDSTKTSTLVTPEKNDKERKNMEGSNFINPVEICQTSMYKETIGLIYMHEKRHYMYAKLII